MYIVHNHYLYFLNLCKYIIEVINISNTHIIPQYDIIVFESGNNM